MQQLFDFLRRWNYVFLFVVLEAVSSVLLFRFNHYQGSVYLTAANTANARIGRWYSDTESFFHLREENTALTSENVRLSKENALLRQALKTAQSEPSEAELRLKARLENFTQIPATVVGNDISTVHNYIVIDKGTAEGVRPEMGVVCGRGVVGIVYLCGPHHSLIMPIIDPKSNISCRVRGQEYFGYLEWDSRSRSHAYLDDIPRYAKIHPGMAIETSGYSAVFPPGLFVGKVCDVKNSADGQSYRLRLNLGTNFATLRDVIVISSPYKAEIDTLRHNALKDNEHEY